MSTSYSDCPCDATPARRLTGPICDDRLLTLDNVSKVQLLGVTPGGKCMTYLTAAKGFLVDDGSGDGQFVTRNPNWTLGYINAAVDDAYPVPSSGWRNILVLDADADGTAWKMVHAPSEGQYVLRSVDGLFQLVTAGALPEISTAFGAADPVTSAEPFVLEYDSGTSEFIAKQLTGSTDGDEHFAVLWKNGSTGRWEIKEADDAGTIAYHGHAMRLFRGLDSGCALIAAGFAARSNSITVADYKFIHYNTTTFIPELAPVPTTATADVNSPLAVGSTYVTAFDFGSVTVNYPRLLLMANFYFDTHESITVGVFIDGVEVKTFNFAEGTGGGSLPLGAYMQNFHITYPFSGVSLGSRAILVKVKTASGSASMRKGYAGVTCLMS